jgi:uncharacterized protein (DUF2141 family)
VGYLTLLLKEIVGQNAFDSAKARMRNDSVYEASKLNNLDQSHATDTGSKLDVILNKFKLRQGTFEKQVFEEIAKFKDSFT